MKKIDPSQPYVQPHWPHYVMMGMFGVLAAGMLQLVILFAMNGDVRGALSLCLLPAGCIGIVLLFWLGMYPRYTVTAEGIEFSHKRQGWKVHVSWNEFTHLYLIAGNKSTHILLASRLMDKPAQYAAVRAYRFRREHPISADGCLVLHGEHLEIIARIPEHIKRVPEWQCCSFWDGYLLL